MEEIQKIVSDMPKRLKLLKKRYSPALECVFMRDFGELVYVCGKKKMLVKC
ncbi:hypothetical protein RP20_CCG027499 [Aedes albopictus]|nr:hypothetical protein RP20_CCG027499 [Aedes albopictus]